jgi:hypothetical protein
MFTGCADAAHGASARCDRYVCGVDDASDVNGFWSILGGP